RELRLDDAREAHEQRIGELVDRRLRDGEDERGRQQDADRRGPARLARELPPRDRDDERGERGPDLPGEQARRQRLPRSKREAAALEGVAEVAVGRAEEADERPDAHDDGRGAEARGPGPRLAERLARTAHAAPSTGSRAPENGAYGSRTVTACPLSSRSETEIAWVSGERGWRRSRVPRTNASSTDEGAPP